MVVEELSRLRLHKITIFVLKFIPVLLSISTFSNQVLSFFGVDIEAFGYLSGTSLLTLLFLYLASYCFEFCSYHRMFLNYVFICDLLNAYDYYIGIPISNIALLLINVIIAGIFLFITLYLYLHDKHNKTAASKNNRRH